MLTPSNAPMPFVLKRRQFSCQLAFAMTIHKSQEQTINWLGLYIPTPVFSHGQLYVACSRVTSPQRLCIFLGQANVPECTKNIKTRLLSATIKQAALDKNCWVISLDLQPEMQIDVSAGRMKFESFSSSNVDTNWHMNNKSEESGSEGSKSSETDILSNSNSDSGQNKVSHFYSSLPVIQIANITNTTPRQFFECFLPIDFIISVIIPATNKYAQFMRFIGILTIMTYIKCADVNDYWSNKQKTARQFDDAFNDNLVNAVLSSPYLCIDDSMCQ
ncbi:5359_t:CDS:2 [Gigaspora margarita]|uniref:5359_t:CDS:1 n=1 Tax=Gigaspora margarita TaxID=4874 RepID=A0ABN7UZR4_GIGMA|nr:5359_t:CDS:2 [Gigaspora margarita]